jgi:uncharacterized protein YukE
VLLALLAIAIWLPAAAAASAPVETAAPVVGGTPRDGSYLHTSVGKWEATRPLTFAYEWRRCSASGEECSPLPSATSHVYKLGHEDVGHTFEAVVRATDEGGSASATSHHSATVLPLKPSKAGVPTIAGVAQDGQLLTANTGAWRGTPPFSFTFKWLSCAGAGASLVCAPIPGATAQGYRPTTEEIGKRVRVTVTAGNGAGSASATSALSKPAIAGPPVATEAPSVSGVPLDGQTLTASTGTWAGTGPFSYSYQWSSCSLVTGECNIIPGATSSTYTAGPLDVASALEVTVTAQGTHGSAAASSPETSAVKAVVPHNSGLPGILGELLDGQLLSVLQGTWTGTGPIAFNYQWLLCNAAGEECTNLSGETGSILKLISGLVGHTIRIAVTATNAGGSTTAYSPPTGPIGALLPSFSSLPSILGSLIDGQALSALTGNWSGSTPLSYSYQWQQCNAKGEECKDISGENGSILKLISGLVGGTVRVGVTASNSGGSTTAYSPASGLVGALLPSIDSLPSIVGSLVDGQLLSALSGSWQGTTPLGYSYQWQECNAKGEECKDMPGETGSALKLISAFVGRTVRVGVTASNSGGATTAYSSPTGLVAALLPHNGSLPSISGLLEDGQNLAAALGSWTGSAPLSYSYQWQRCNNAGEECKDMAGETGSILKLVSGLIGQTVRLGVTATNSGGTTTAYSTPTNPIAALLPHNGSLPSISGLLEDGQNLAAALGSWTGSTPLAYGYQWQQCNAKGEECKDMPGETGSVLKLISAFVGGTVRLGVTATNPGGSTTAYSTPTSPIAALLPHNGSLPSIAGSLIDGQALSVLTGNWSGSTPLSYSYQWQQCNSNGEACKDISGESGSILKLISAFVGQTLRVGVTATNSGGSTTAYSPATGLIAALLPSNTSPPTIAGTPEDGHSLGAASGGWSGSTPISYSYQWQQCNGKGEECKALAGETKETLGLIPNLVRSTVRLAVTATNAGGSTQAVSAPTSPVLAALPINLIQPVISGFLKLGEWLFARHESWSGTAPLAYTYQWQLCGLWGFVYECNNIPGATQEHILLELFSLGLTLRVGVTAHNERGESETVYSKVTGLIQEF